MPCFLFNGRFAAALNDQKMNSWVMNVVPVSGPNTLPVIYDRGLIGVAHDWYYLVTFIVVSVFFSLFIFCIFKQSLASFLSNIFSQSLFSLGPICIWDTVLFYGFVK